MAKSNIHGNGIFARVDLKSKEDIGVSIPLILDTPTQVIFERNTFGLLINHSDQPNAECKKIGDNWHFVTLKPISSNEEIMVDYKNYEQKIDSESLITRKKVSVL